jgi:hypothetical protein
VRKAIAGSLLPPGQLLAPIEEGVLLGEQQPGAIARGIELHRRERHGRHGLPAIKGRGVDDPPIRNDVVVNGLERQQRAVLMPATVDLSTADSEVELVLGGGTS